MKVDRLFLDANILFSIAYGSPGLTRLWRLAQKRKCLLFASNYVIEEARHNLPDPDQIKKLDDFLSVVQIVPEVDPHIPCPIDLPEKDRPVLLAVLSIRADYLLTGDRIHFGKYFGRTVGGVKILQSWQYFSRQGRKKD